MSKAVEILIWGEYRCRIWAEDDVLCVEYIDTPPYEPKSGKWLLGSGWAQRYVELFKAHTEPPPPP